MSRRSELWKMDGVLLEYVCKLVRLYQMFVTNSIWIDTIGFYPSSFSVSQICMFSSFNSTLI